ncbi:MAG TPA: hypothetical protein VLM38_16370 [Blastocatellia bacterium]|nr:hypothetical protein [Blastocatellia bacterium]
MGLDYQKLWERHTKVQLIAGVVLSVTLVSSYSAQSRELDRQHVGLKGAVKLVREEEAKLKLKFGQLAVGKRAYARSDVYDEAGNLISAESMFRGDLVRMSYKYEANAERTEISKSGSTMRTRAVLRYDAQGRRIEEERHDDDGRIRRMLYTRDASGHIVQTIRYWDGERGPRATFTYDADGNVFERVNYNGTEGVEGIERYSYEFDGAGNWIKRTTSRGVLRRGQITFEPSLVTYRTLTYY